MCKAISTLLYLDVGPTHLAIEAGARQGSLRRILVNQSSEGWDGRNLSGAIRPAKSSGSESARCSTKSQRLRTFPDTNSPFGLVK